LYDAEPALIDIPPDWHEALTAGLAGSGRVLLLGPRDAGKSTFTLSFLQAAAARTIPAAILDLDVGQKLVGPPACVTLGCLGPHGLDLTGLAFVGTTDPVRGWRPLMAGAERLSREAPQGSLVINTGGLLAGPGRRLKAEKIAVLQPDLLIAIGTDPDLEALLAVGHAPALRLAPSPLARRKTEGERRAARREAFRAYFAGARGHAGPLADPALAEAPPGTLLGLADAAGRDIGVGLLREADPASGIVRYSAPALPRDPAAIRASALVLREDCSEMRRRPEA
jgi:polynucleotide 5'-hydroxyl-kinase GRC3/NOL9